MTMATYHAGHIAIFQSAYIEALYFTDTGEDDQPSDPAQLAADSVLSIHADCVAFLEKAPPIATAKLAAAGHDFWLTRNGHGVGFWDGDWPEEQGEQLTALSDTFGELYTYQGDNGLLYVEGG